MIGKLYYNLFISFFIGTIVIFASSYVESTAELTTNVKFNEIFKRATQKNAEQNLFNCTETEFSCVSRGCIKKSDLCNGVKDCKDGSDETILVCRNFKCPNNSFFRCDYGACIRATLKCDGRVDCADKSDEAHKVCNDTKPLSNSTVLRRCRPNDQWRCKTSKECILKSAKCNGKKDCKDGSDEDIQDCKGIKPVHLSGAASSQNVLPSLGQSYPLGSNATSATTIKPKPSPVNQSLNRTCNIPYHRETNTLVLTDSEENRLNISLFDLSAPKFSRIEMFCKPTYALANGEKTQTSFCLNGKWLPALRSCQKSCPTLLKNNIDFTCYRNDLITDCSGEIVSGTTVRPVCKPLYRSEAKIHGKLTCLESGEWDRDMPKCVPECGIPNILPESQYIVGGSPANTNDFPWHVAIYKLSTVSSDMNILICGGTLISANMVLSAAHCFFDESRNTILNSFSNYEVVVSKYSRNHTIIDNDYQKTYKIRDMIFTKQGYHPVSTGQHSNDIVVLVLKTPVEISTHVLPACVDWSANEFQPAEGTLGKFAGWGESEIKGREGSPILLYAELPFISYGRCVGKIKELDPDKFCAGSERGAGARKGDSGGGLVFRDASTNRIKYFVRCIVSTRDAKSRNSYATYTDISKHIEWLASVRAKVEAGISENQKKTSDGVCDVQYSQDRRIELFDKNDKLLNISSSSAAPEYSTIVITCNPTFTLPNGKTTQRSVCLQENKWTPPLEPCLKVCKVLGPLDTIDLSCYREDYSEVDCYNTTFIIGSKVRPRCKNLYQMQGEATYRELKCQENGEWNNELFECVPNCGIMSDTVWEPPTDWIPADNIASPWRVIIYKRQLDGQMEAFCGGTLISVKMVVSAASCFYDRTTGEVFNSTSDYEVMVSKYSTDYDMIDSDYLKNYTIREIIFGEVNSTTSMANIVVLWLETRVDIHEYVLPACIDWYSNTTDFRLAGSKSNVNSHSFGIDVSLHVELRSCSAKNTCTKSNTTSTITWAGYHGGGLLFPADSIGGKRYFLRGVATSLDVETVADISNHIDWLKKVRDRVGWL